MRTRSQSCNRQQQQVPQTFVEPFDLEEPIDNPAPLVVTMADNRTMAQLLQAPTEGYEDAIVVPTITVDNFELKHVRHSRSKAIVAKVGTSTFTTGISPDVAELKDMVKALLLDKKNQSQAPATVKAVEESCVTCGGAHSYRNCPATDGNVYRDNIQAYASQAAAVNYNQGNTGYRPPMVANQIRPPGFPPVQQNQGNNQNRYNQNRGNNFNQGPIYRPPVNQPPAYQAPAPQTQGVSKEDFQNYIKANDAVMKNMQNQNQNMQNQMTNLTNLLTNFVNSNTASTSGSGSLPSNTIANPKGDIKAITTRSGVSYKVPTIPTTSSSLPKVVERETEVTKDTMPPTNNASTEDVQPPVVQVETHVPILEPVVAPTGRALIDVYEGELTLRVGKEAVTFNLDQTSRYSSNYDDNSVNRIDVIEMACEEYSQEVLGFSDVIASGNPTPYYDPIVSTSSPTLTPFGDNDFLLEEVDTFLALEDDPTLPEVDHSYHDSEGDILLLKAFLNDDPSLPPPTQGMHVLKVYDGYFYDMIKKMMEVFMDDFSVFGNSFGTYLSHLDKMLKRCEHTNLCLNWEKSHFMVKEGIVLGHKISKNGIEVDKDKVDFIAKLPHPTTVKGIWSFLGHAGFYHRFIQDFSKIARPMTYLLEKDTPFFFSKECIEAF
ncbi:hypothetical protein Tco_0121750 [Tanacetum coccineum]